MYTYTILPLSFITNEKVGIYVDVCAMNCHYRFYTLEDFFKKSFENGFQYVELWTGPMHFYLDCNGYDPVENLRQLERKYKLKVIGVCPEQTNPKPNNMAAKSTEEQERVFAYFKNAIDIAYEINANQVVVTSGWAYLSENKDEAKQRSAKMLNRLAQYGASKNIPLAIEALQPMESVLVNTISDLKGFLDLVNHDNLKICLDFGAMAKAKENVNDYFEAFGTRVIHCHFVDGNPTGHMAWGDGTRCMSQDLNTLEKYNYTGLLSFEIVNRVYYRKPFEADKKSKFLFDKWRKEIC